MIPSEWIDQAVERIAPYITTTPVTFDPAFDYYCKWENHQRTGSFKVRGAINKVLSLQPWERESGLVAASAGNHGQGVALAAAICGCQAVIFLPENASKVKLEAIRAAGGQLKLVPGGYEMAEEAAQSYSRGSGMTWISPYNDIQVICGQATLGCEIISQLDMNKIDRVVIPIGGGGLISGIGTVIKEKFPGIQVIGAQAAGSPFFYNLFTRDSQEGIIEHTGVADGLEGRVEDTSITIPMVKEIVDDIFIVSEEDIKDGIRYAWKKYHEIIEGSAAVALAVCLNGKMKQKATVVVLSGGNIDKILHQEIISTNVDAE